MSANEIIFHDGNAADLSSNAPLPQEIHHPILEKGFPKLDDLNVHVLQFPDLSFGEFRGKVPSITSNHHKN